MIKVFIIDDHKMVVEGLMTMMAAAPGIESCGYALGGEAAIARVKEVKPDVILLDISLPDIDGIKLCGMLQKEYPEGKVIALTMHKEGSLVRLMLQNGARGYVLKNAGQDEIIRSIQKVFEGSIYLEETVNNIIIQSLHPAQKSKYSSPFPTLSRRERDVLELILKELTTQEIAEKLFISFGTVETHRRNMLIKTGARNTAGLVRIALEYNLLSKDL